VQLAAIAIRNGIIKIGGDTYSDKAKPNSVTRVDVHMISHNTASQESGP